MKKSVSKKGIFFILILLVSLAGAFEVPNYYGVQFAGHRGVVSVGAGYEYFDNHLLSMVQYGYTPELLAGTDVHSLTVQQSLAPYWLHVNSNIQVSPILSVSAIFSPQYDIFVLDRFRSYYWPAGVRIGYYLGVKARYLIEQSLIKEWSFGAYAGTLQSYLVYLDNEGVDVSDVVTLTVDLGIGI